MMKKALLRLIGKKSHFSIQRGFSLVELLVAMTIIGVLATISMANFIGAQSRGRDAQRKASLRQLQSAFELYRADNASYPLAPLPACGQPLAASGSVYIQKIPCDPQNAGQFVFQYTSDGTTYTLTTCLENVNDSNKDSVNNSTYCSGGTTNWSHTVTNP
jgi:prepilin-type N-terminal cleavage/methylation domain-containing protein